MKTLFLAVVTALTFGLSAQADVFTLNGSNTTLQKVEGYYVDTFFTAYSGTGGVGIVSTGHDGGYYPQFSVTRELDLDKEAFAWSAPAGEHIVKIEFLDTYNGDPRIFQSVIYDLSAGGALASSTPIYWTSPAQYGGSSTPRSITVPFSSGLTSIGFGFSTSSWSDYGPIAKDWQVDFSSIVITTIPEPASLTLLAVAGMLVMGRQRARR